MIRNWLPLTIAITSVLLFAGCGGTDQPVANANYVAVEPLQAAPANITPQPASAANRGSADANDLPGSAAVATQASSDSIPPIAAPLAPSAGPAGTVPITTVPTNAVSTNTVPTNTLPAEQFDAVTAVYASFLEQRATAILGELDVDALSNVATSNARNQVTEQRQGNDARRDESSASTLTDLMEWPNVTAVFEDGDRLVFTDCTEQQSINWVGTTSIRFVTNDVTMVRDGDTYKVDGVTETQNGSFTEAPGIYGCVPDSLSERAESLATEVVNHVADAVANPDDTLERGLSPIFADEARIQLESALDYLASENLTQELSPAMQLKIVGMDVNKPDFTVIMSVCRHYPEGRSIVDATTGDVVDSDLSIGTSEEEWMYLRLDPVAAGSAASDAIVSVRPQSTNCWEN